MELVTYDEKYEPQLFAFLSACLPESGRYLDLDGRHQYYRDIRNHFIGFWCLWDEESIIGTVAVSEMTNETCELKSLYLLEKYQRHGYGRQMLAHAIEAARQRGYRKMYLDSLSTSTNAVALYRKMGFVDTEKYNNSVFSNVFMVLDLF